MSPFSFASKSIEEVADGWLVLVCRRDSLGEIVDLLRLLVSRQVLDRVNEFRTSEFKDGYS